MSVQKTINMLRMLKLAGRSDELLAENFTPSDGEPEDITEQEWYDLPRELRTIIEDKKHVLTYSYGDSSFKLKPIKVNTDDKDEPDLAKPKDYEKDGGDAKKTNKKMADNSKLTEDESPEDVGDDIDELMESFGVSDEQKGAARTILNHLRANNGELNFRDYDEKQEYRDALKKLDADQQRQLLSKARAKFRKNPDFAVHRELSSDEWDDEHKAKQDHEKQVQQQKADEILKKSRLNNADFGIHESYQNRQEFENDEDANEYFGHKHPHETKVKLPKEVKTKIAANIKRVKDYVKDNPEKEFKDGEKAVDAMEHIESELSSGDYEGFLKAQMFFQTLSGPIADFFPSELVTFLSTGHQNQDGDSGYNKEVEPFETKLSESYMFNREEKFNQYFIDEVLPGIVKKYGYDDKPAIDQTYNDTLDAYEKDGMLPDESRSWTLPDQVVDDPANYVTESVKTLVEYGTDSFDQSNTAVETWFERDRAYVGLYPVDDEGKPDTNKKAIVEWWDEDVNEAIEDGFLDPRDLHGSALDYAKHIGLIKESKKSYSFKRILEAKKKGSKSKDPCWKGYEQVGTKTKDGKEVPNCVPKDKLKESVEIADDEFYVCPDCASYIANDDLTGLDYHYDEQESEEREREIRSGVNNLHQQGYYVAAGDNEKDKEFSSAPCKSCGDKLAGYRHHMNLLKK